ncbi:MAG: SPASM domain-containing protein [Magnetococcales bacterium]|nr:SPASM domain-containing protein [Magnetococcales bacterium]
MKAKIIPRINLEGRTPLQTVIPLATPYILYVDPASICNFRCDFCPTGDKDLIAATGRWQGRMEWDLYRKVIDDLSAFERPLKVLRLYKEGEPLLNKKMPDMIRYAKASGRVNYIDTTTNGEPLTPDLSLALIEAGLDKINISVDGLSDEQFMRFTKTNVDFDKYVEKISYLYENRGNCEIVVKTSGDMLSEEEKKRFFELFGDICDRIFIENFAPCWPEFDVEERTGIEIRKGIYDNPIGQVDTCPYIFYSLSINSDGTVSLCFLDWARKLIVGDARTQSLIDIWNGAELHAHRVANLTGARRRNPTCGACGQLSHCLPDNIDPYAAELLARIQAGRG